ncbi:MAG TPA: hypothetical protein VMT91_06205 [Anaerolineales bacterium]|nr:hypothetical protein [Anaerolineales bacterium]
MEKGVFTGCAGVFLQNNEDQFWRVGEEYKYKGVLTYPAQFNGVFKQFYRVLSRFWAGGQELFLQTNPKEGLLFTNNRPFLDCF